MQEVVGSIPIASTIPVRRSDLARSNPQRPRGLDAACNNTASAHDVSPRGRSDPPEPRERRGRGDELAERRSNGDPVEADQPVDCSQTSTVRWPGTLHRELGPFESSLGSEAARHRSALRRPTMIVGDAVVGRAPPRRPAGRGRPCAPAIRQAVLTAARASRGRRYGSRRRRRPASDSRISRTRSLMSSSRPERLAPSGRADSPPCASASRWPGSSGRRRRRSPRQSPSSRDSSNR